MLAGAAAPVHAAEEAQATAARIEPQSVVHAGEGVTVRVPAMARYIGGDRFTLYDVADAEVHVFVEADSEGRVNRLYWIQFESYLPSEPNRRYNYAEGNRRMEMGGIPTWVRAVPANIASVPAREGSDRERVMSILARAGISLPADVLNVRLVQLLDDPEGTGRGRRELMLIYSEDLTPAGFRAEDFITDGGPNARGPAVEEPVIARAMAAFEVERR